MPNKVVEKQTCTKCGTAVEESDRFCGHCGGAVGEPQPGAVTDATSTGSKPAKRKTNMKWLALASFFIPLLLFVALFFLSSGVEGTMTARGELLGHLDFEAHNCAAGQNEQFFGVFILGDGPSDGGIKLVKNASTETWGMHVELPGSCKGPDDENCTVIPVPLERCATANVSVKPTGTLVNYVREVEGSLELDCKFEDGSTISAKIEFGGCH